MLNILIIEDDEAWQMKLQIMLEEFDHKINKVATSLSEASSFLKINTPNIIISDIRLSDGFSFDFFQRNSVNCPIIFISAYADREFLNQTIAIPHSSFYVKPFPSLTLLAGIKGAMLAFQNSNPKPSPTINIPVRYGQKMDLPIDKIHWITVDGNYSTIKTATQQYVQKVPFTKIRPYLDDRFIQINKSAIVNKEHITNFNLTKDTVIIQEKVFSISRFYRTSFIESIYNNH